jgi:hypothetical protein
MLRLLTSITFPFLKEAITAYRALKISLISLLILMKFVLMSFCQIDLSIILIAPVPI